MSHKVLLTKPGEVGAFFWSGPCREGTGILIPIGYYYYYYYSTTAAATTTAATTTTITIFCYQGYFAGFVRGTFISSICLVYPNLVSTLADPACPLGRAIQKVVCRSKSGVHLHDYSVFAS